MGHFAVMTRLVNNQACSPSHPPTSVHFPSVKTIAFQREEKSAKNLKSGIEQFYP
ncbi:hypothetical protein [Photobacterium alginatilyticum]|uniref:hypothetical protein n=1 Tax=Photobacterium alginatilyticum TaxID=1775171 RepID=UPI00136D2EC6|nr:hypothetical protein [Photobacterium alginatilyticum]